MCNDLTENGTLRPTCYDDSESNERSTKFYRPNKIQQSYAMSTAHQSSFSLQRRVEQLRRQQPEQKAKLHFLPWLIQKQPQLADQEFLCFRQSR